MSKIQIKKKKLLLVEGKDEISFFEVLLKKMRIEENVQPIECKGKDQFENFLPEIMKIPGFDNVISIAVIQDADENSQAAFQRIHTVLKNNNLDPPRTTGSFQSITTQTEYSIEKVGIFIIPDGINKGNLESLCLSTILELNSIKECFDSFIKCVKQKTPFSNNRYEEPKNTYKAYSRAFLSTMEKDTPSLGVAAKKSYWNLDSEKLKPLSDFLRKL